MQSNNIYYIHDGYTRTKRIVGHAYQAIGHIKLQQEHYRINNKVKFLRTC